MNGERLRIEAQRDSENKDNEIGDIRAQYQRRVCFYIHFFIHKVLS